MIYRLYTWRLKKEDDTPKTTVELLMCLPHYLQILSLYAFISYLFPKIDSLIQLTKFQLLFIALGFQLLFHLLMYKKKRWLGYIEQFKNETTEQKRKGTILIQIYHVLSVVLFFIGLMILLMK